MKAIVCGDRYWTNQDRIQKVLQQLEVTKIIQGECKGADLLAKNVAIKLDWSIESFPANWSKYGKSAGPIRNKAMLFSKPDIVVAFHNNIEISKGTINMLNQAKAAKIQCYLVTETSIDIY